jgi:hypothetical protein
VIFVVARSYLKMCGPNFIVTPIMLIILLMLSGRWAGDLVLVDGRYWRVVKRKSWWRRA